MYDVFTVTSNYILKTSGVWNFIGNSKIEEFKKNWRVEFNILFIKSTYTETIEDEYPIVTIRSQNYIDGPYDKTYTVVESSRKELKLKSDSQYSYLLESDFFVNSTFSSNGTSTLTLT